MPKYHRDPRRALRASAHSQNQIRRVVLPLLRARTTKTTKLIKWSSVDKINEVPGRQVRNDLARTAQCWSDRDSRRSWPELLRLDVERSPFQVANRSSVTVDGIVQTSPPFLLRVWIVLATNDERKAVEMIEKYPSDLQLSKLYQPNDSSRLLLSY